MTKPRPWSELKEKVLADPARRARIEEGASALRDGIALSTIRAELGLAEYNDPRDIDDDDEVVPYEDTNDAIYVATLRDYITAIGGHLEINAVFPDGTLTLHPNRTWAVLTPSK